MTPLLAALGEWGAPLLGVAGGVLPAVLGFYILIRKHNLAENKLAEDVLKTLLQSAVEKWKELSTDCEARLAVIETKLATATGKAERVRSVVWLLVHELERLDHGNQLTAEALRTLEAD